MLDGASFADLVRNMDYPMFIVTVGGAEPAGCLVGFATQTSIDPARFAVGISKQNRTFDVAVAASHAAVHLLDADDLELARLFGETTGDEVDKFALCRWHVGLHGVPTLDAAAGLFVGRIIDRWDAGDHLVHLLDPLSVEIRRLTAGTLTFDAVRDFHPGHDA